MALPKDAQERKARPLATGVLDYFPDALTAVAEVSRVGNEQHNPGQPLHWAKEKSTDEADALLRHLIDRGKLDSDGMRHSAKVAWRALALLQREIEGEAISGSESSEERYVVQVYGDSSVTDEASLGSPERHSERTVEDAINDAHATILAAELTSSQYEEDCG